MDRKTRRDSQSLSQRIDEILSILREIRELLEMKKPEEPANNIRYTDDDYRELLEFWKGR